MNIIEYYDCLDEFIQDLKNLEVPQDYIEDIKWLIDEVKQDKKLLLEDVIRIEKEERKALEDEYWRDRI